MTAVKRRGTSRSRTVLAWQRGRHTAAVKGPVRVIHREILALGVPWQWCHRSGAYLVPLKRIDDLMAALELAGHRVDYKQALW